jgi:hypothetical protein
MLSGEANREAPGSGGASPSCARPAMSKRQRVEWASGVNLHLTLTPMGFTLVSVYRRGAPIVLVLVVVLVLDP